MNLQRLGSMVYVVAACTACSAANAEDSAAPAAGGSSGASTTPGGLDGGPWASAGNAGNAGGQGGSGNGALGGNAGQAVEAGAAGASGSGGGQGGGASGPVSNGAVISCSNTPCQAGAQHCCITGEGSGNPPAFQCIPASVSCGLSALTRQCDGPEDCASGERCCANTLFPSTPAACRAQCSEGEQPTCWGAAECGSLGPHCCFFAGRPAGFCKSSPHPGATLCVQ
ncbi:MAG: hypothetical protein IPI67_23685 [Myxococcales bacterium]|nr:hypothetical protein [Myxococcales bacterium]